MLVQSQCEYMRRKSSYRYEVVDTELFTEYSPPYEYVIYVLVLLIHASRRSALQHCIVIEALSLHDHSIGSRIYEEMAHPEK